MLQDFSDFLRQLLIFQWELRTRLFCIIFVKSADTRFCSIICVEIIQSFIRKVSRTLFRTFALGNINTLLVYQHHTIPYPYVHIHQHVFLTYLPLSNADFLNSTNLKLYVIQSKASYNRPLDSHILVCLLLLFSITSVSDSSS